jgi:hypothetical protein
MGVYAFVTQPGEVVVNMEKNGMMQEQMLQQNVFDDFIAAALTFDQFKIYFLPIFLPFGGSNGGLLEGSNHDAASRIDESGICQVVE